MFDFKQFWNIRIFSRIPKSNYLDVEIIVEEDFEIYPHNIMSPKLYKMLECVFENSNVMMEFGIKNIIESKLIFVI